MKLLTAVTALSRSDADNPFCTEVWYDGVIEHDTLQGNLYVVGGFDPEFDSLMMDSLIEEVITFPFSVISGQVYGDVSMKDSLYWGHGWAWETSMIQEVSLCMPFLERLRAKGIVVPESYGFTELPADGVEQMARWGDSGTGSAGTS